jgi:hypothetical protein
MIRHLVKCPARMSLVNQRLPTDTIPLAIFWEFFVLSRRPRPPAGGKLNFAKFLKEVWSGRPGSNRRRPAWEFSNEFCVFLFRSKNLIGIYRPNDVAPSFSNFN